MSDSCADPKGSVGAFLCRAGQHLRAAAIPQPRMEARMLLARAMGVTQEALLRDPRAPVPKSRMRPTAARCGNSSSAASTRVSVSARGIRVSGEVARSSVQKPWLPVR